MSVWTDFGFCQMLYGEEVEGESIMMATKWPQEEAWMVSSTRVLE